MRLHAGAIVTIVAILLVASCSDDKPMPGGVPTSAVGGSGGNGGHGGAGVSLADLCERSCYAKGELDCADFDHDICWTECFFAPLIMPWCADLAHAWIHCVGPQPASSFVCNAEPGEQPVTGPGVCAAELEGLFSCWFEGPARGLPDLSGDCARMCADQSGLTCYAASCEADCIAAIAEPAECNGARAGMLHCLAVQPDPAYICDLSSAPELVGDGCELYDEIILGCESI